MRLRYFSIASIGMAAAFAACVGDAPATTAPDDGGGDSSTTTDGQVADTSTGGDSACVPNCGSSCVDLTSDPKNCGVCGHDCLGGKCSGSACQASALFTGKSPDASVAGVAAIVVDSSQIFWLTPALPYPGAKAGSILSTIYRCAVGADCSVPAIHYQQQGEIDDIAASQTAGELFFTDNYAGQIDRISSLGVDAGAALGACSGHGSPCIDVGNVLYANTLAVGATNVYAGSSTNDGQNGQAQISFGPVNGTGAAGVAVNAAVSGSPASIGLAQDESAGFIYAAMSNGTISIFPTGETNASATNTITGQATIGQMVVANGLLFWTNPTLGKVFTIAHCVGTSCQNGFPSPIPPQTFASTPHAFGLSVDAKNVYWSAGGQIFACSLDGCPDAGPTMLANGTVTVRAIANDATSIYWGDDQGSIWQLAK